MIPLEFILFAATLACVAIFHRHSLQAALAGMTSILVLKLARGFPIVAHLGHEWRVLVNLLGLLLGFAILAKHFEESRIPERLPALLPAGWKGGFVLLAVGFGSSMIWFGSSAGVAITLQFPEARSVGRWLRHGWPIVIAYVAGFFAMLLLLGWRPQPKKAISLETPGLLAYRRSCESKKRSTFPPPPRRSGITCRTTASAPNGTARW